MCASSALGTASCRRSSFYPSPQNLPPASSHTRNQLASGNTRHVGGLPVTLYSYHYFLLPPSTFSYRLFHPPSLRPADQETIPSTTSTPFRMHARYSRICKYIVDARVHFFLGLRTFHRSSPSVISGRCPMTHVQIMSLPRLLVSSFRFETLSVVMPPPPHYRSASISFSLQ